MEEGFEKANIGLLPGHHSAFHCLQSGPLCTHTVQHSEGNSFPFSKLILNIFHTKQSYAVNNEETETNDLSEDY